MNVIQAEALTKTFKVTKRRSGLRGALAGLVCPKTSIVTAVEDVNFSIGQGEIVGYLGPNGSGKSTSIKMLCGVLRPTSGRALINGLDPQKSRMKIARRIGVVFGQRTQLFWDLRLGESFELQKHIYQIPQERFAAMLSHVDTYVGIRSFIDTPVRQLSLGQRMRGEIAAALLHSPSVLFLDEPTIGLDVDAKYGIREMIRATCSLSGTTVVLTTHDLQDVEELCSRLIVINHGMLVADGPLDVLLRQIAPTRVLNVEFISPQRSVSHPKARVLANEGVHCQFEFNPLEISAPQLISELAFQHELRDLRLLEPDIEDLVCHLYSKPRPSSTVA